MSAKSDSRSNKAVKSEEPKKRRRKKARTVDVSDSDSSDSDSDGAKDSEDEEDIEETSNDLPEDADVEMMEFEKGDTVSADTMDIPAELQALPDDSANPEFQKFYMNLVTTEFGKDMDELRTGPTFNGATLGLLVDALKQGVNVFDEKVQREIVEEKN
ncbi:Ribosome assembly protein 3 [Yarrowia sp. C11]|nr:Ribosome assembly protein 3 [Yarrowia sp. E02]KAG5367729.1 Ribosome assembly protein 3 [Yarrowia sp. C11]